MNKFMEKLLIASDKMQNNKYLTAIRHAFATLLPISIAGAFSVLILHVVTSTTTTGLSLAKIPFLSWLEFFSPIFEMVNFATLGMLTIALVIVIALEMGRIFNEESIVLPVVALASYLTTTNPNLLISVGGAEELIEGVLTQQFSGTEGLFIGMVVALAASRLFIALSQSSKLSITMPESVPSNVSKAFSNLIPGILTIILVSTVSFAFFKVSGLTLFEVITAIIQAPLQGFLLSLPGYLFITFLMLLLWTAGIHGDSVLGSIVDPLLISAVLMNADLASKGQEFTNILNASFHVTFSMGTGSGITGALIIAIFLVSKRDDYKAIAKLSISPALFNINEPIIFGLPIVFNPILMIPFVLAPLASITFGYVMTKIGIAKIMYIMVPWTTPPLLKSFLATGGHIPTVLVELGSYVIVVLIYLPFVSLANKEKNI